MTGQNENHGQSFDPRDAIQPHTVALFCEEDLLSIVQERERDDDLVCSRLLLSSLIDAGDLVGSTDEDDDYEEQYHRSETIEHL